MDTVAIALSLGIPCLCLAFVFAFVAVKLELDTDSDLVEKMLKDERTVDLMTVILLKKRIKQCEARIIQANNKINRHQAERIKCQQARLEHRLVIAALTDLSKASWRKPQARKRVATLPYHEPVKVAS